MTDQVDAALRPAGIDASPLDGTQVLALLWDRLHPAAGEVPDFDELACACQIATATNRHQAGKDRQRIFEAIAAGVELDSSEHPAWIRHGISCSKRICVPPR